MTPDEMDLLVEQVKMLAGEIAFSKSTLKRLVDQSVNDPENSKPQVKILLYISRIQYICRIMLFLILTPLEKRLVPFLKL